MNLKLIYFEILDQFTPLSSKYVNLIILIKVDLFDVLYVFQDCI